jgi:hypothetical protein
MGEFAYDLPLPETPMITRAMAELVVVLCIIIPNLSLSLFLLFGNTQMN